MSEINFQENDFFEPNEEEVFIKKEMVKGKLYKERENIKEEQEVMWKLLLDYNELVDSKEKDLSFKEAGKENIKVLINKERIIPVTNRTFDEISAAYDLEPGEFEEVIKDKKVLDIGSGNSTFLAESKKRGINANIASVDIDANALRFSNKNSGVKARAELLPFKDEEFDLVVSTYSLPIWADSPEMARSALLEEVRVVKKGGKIYISPIVNILSRPSIKNSSEKLFRYSYRPNPVLEEDESIQKMLLSVQKEFIETLKNLKDEGIVNIKLGRNYLRGMKHRSVEQIKDSVPSIAIIEKMK